MIKKGKRMEKGDRLSRQIAFRIRKYEEIALKEELGKSKFDTLSQLIRHKLGLN